MEENQVLAAPGQPQDRIERILRILGHSAGGAPTLNSAGATRKKNVAREETMQR